MFHNKLDSPKHSTPFILSNPVSYGTCSTLYAVSKINAFGVSWAEMYKLLFKLDPYNNLSVFESDLKRNLLYFAYPGQ